MMPWDAAADPQNARDQVLAAVRVRFALDPDEFVARVLDVARRNAAAGSVEDLDLTRNLDDLYLATACAHGDERAWAEFIAEHFDFVRRFARRLLPDCHAGDLAHDVIADLWQRRKIERYEGRSSLTTWLGTIVSNAAINLARTMKQRDRQLALDAAFQAVCSVSDVDDPRQSHRLTELLAESIARQPVCDRFLLLLYYERGLTLQEISGVMRLSKAALSRRLKRIRRAVLETTDMLAHDRFGTSARSLVDGLELSAIDLDLRAACTLPVRPGLTSCV